MKNNELFFENVKPHIHMDKLQFDIMKQKGWITEVKDGLVIYGNAFRNVMQKLDDLILTWGKENSAIEVYYPDLYRIEDLEQCNYIDQFHPHCLFPYLSQTDQYIESETISSGFVANPAVCMHCYIQYKNTIINEDEPVKILCKGKCKRREKKGYITLERLLDFTMREIVFIGTEDFVLNKRTEFMEKAKQFMINMQLEGNICVSNDPFFLTKDKAKVDFQRKFKLKYEMNLKIPASNHMIAVGSFNYHNVNFSKAYNIRNSQNQYVHSACVAFGLERFAYACIEQLGLENIDKCNFFSWDSH